MDIFKFYQMTNMMNERVEQACLAAGQTEAEVYYSAYPEDAEETPVDNLDQVAVEGRCILVCDYDDFWGGEGEDYRSDVLENPTWLQVAVCANAMIQRTRDFHHRFLENVRLRTMEGDVAVYELIMGS